jgi:uncharacterized SAM-dependent methyltransferase
MEKFILPEKWCIKVTKENSLIVGEVFGKIAEIYKDWTHNEVSFRSRPYLRSHNDYDDKYSNLEAHSSFSFSYPQGLELTTEEFIKYVLNKEQSIINDSDLENIYKKLLNIV